MTRSAASDDTLTLDRLRLRVAAGAPPGDTAALPDRSRRALAVAVAVGAPLVDAIDGAQAAEDDAARARRAVVVASAQTKAVAGGLLLAPALLVPALGRLVGADLVGFYTSARGLVVLAVGLALLLVGGAMIVVLVRRVGSDAHQSAGQRAAVLGALVAAGIAWRLVGPVAAPLAALASHHVLERRASLPPPAGIDEAADLTATALAGGVATPEALRVAADELPVLAHRLRRIAFSLELGMAANDLAPGHAGRRGPPADGFTRFVTVLGDASDLGAPLGPTLRRLARDLRADELARVLAAAERLPVQLTFPTALCLLPATVLLVGAPIVQAGLTAAGA